jgi:hypothetical protein
MAGPMGERTALRTLKDNTHLTILPADIGNATVILNTTDYKQKIASLLEDSAYKKLKKDPTDSRTENHTTTEKVFTTRLTAQANSTCRLQSTTTIRPAEDTQRRGPS